MIKNQGRSCNSFFTGISAKLPTKPSPSTTRDYHLFPIISNDHFTFRAQLTSFYLHPTDYTFKIYDKNQDFFTSIASKIMSPYQFWLDNGIKSFALQFNCLRLAIKNLKTDKNDLAIFHVHAKRHFT